jgi:hypothetical protein
MSIANSADVTDKTPADNKKELSAIKYITGEGMTIKKYLFNAD